MSQERSPGQNYQPQKSPYEILGISPNASESEIKSAFRRRAKETHPDRPENKGRSEEFRIAREAYETLSDSNKKQEYDAAARTNRSSKQPQSSSHSASPPPPKQESRKPKQTRQEEAPREKRRGPELTIGSWVTLRPFRYSERERISNFEIEVQIMERKGDYFIGKDRLLDWYYLIDPQTITIIGGSLGFQKIEFSQRHFVGSRNKGPLWVLNQKEHRWTRTEFKEIVIRSGLLIGKNRLGLEFLLDKNTGGKLTSFYKRIERKDNKIFGYKIFGEVEEIGEITTD